MPNFNPHIDPTVWKWITAGLILFVILVMVVAFRRCQS
jgi:hypothetical protein